MPFIEKLLELLEYENSHICHTTHVTCPALAHFFNTLLTLAMCEFPLVSVYDSDSSNHVLSKNIF